MKEQSLTESGWRGSPEGWLEAAYDVLIDSGVDAVKIMPLANRLKLSRTSFYWFFKDRDELLKALSNRWEECTTAPLIAATQEYAESEAESLLNVVSCFLPDQGFDVRLEFAVRSWALQDAGIMARVQDADQKRLAALRALLEKWGHEPMDADVRARTIYLVQIGYISMQVKEPLSVRMPRIPHYVEIYSGGKRPAAREIARFHARHGYSETEPS
ncbi:TetR/AcrR family transcriptional regulator [Paracoccus aminophilus]|uniref:Transcriptional regulator, TetR family n=1 Tax=Paracoccus aminophilus JCM 7686 TaxID=1367847 RepID=S5YIB3_PARAH|nr:TetR/AcrR family transcriptional regulator [Paracoccus aminophilus]AGT11218.1 transcriptional regulator, TetR family [Paracoccus aminophilus JCM 7686]